MPWCLITSFFPHSLSLYDSDSPWVRSVPSMSETHPSLIFYSLYKTPPLNKTPLGPKLEGKEWSTPHLAFAVRISFDRFGEVAKHWYLFIRMSLNDVNTHLQPRSNASVLPTARRKSAYFITLSLLEKKKRSRIPRIVFKPASHHIKLLNVSSRPSRIWVPVPPIFRCFWTRYLEWRICNSPRVFVSVSALLLHCFIHNEKTEKAYSSQQSSAGGGGGKH